MKLLLSCEHGGNLIPKEYHSLFQNGEGVLNSHRGYDPGALELFHRLKSLAHQSFFSTTSRLLVELNRSPGHPQLFSEFSKSLSFKEKQRIMQSYYFPYRDEIEKLIARTIEDKENILHLSIHTFSPQLKGKVRNADIGLLFDPARSGEKDFARIWKFNLKKVAPELKVRFNYPYLGRADGLTTYFRKKYPLNYLGIELEMNQSFSDTERLLEEISDYLYLSLQQSIK